MIPIGVLAVAVAVCCGLAAPTPARHVVDPAGGDDGSGTGAEQRPFRTITRALAVAGPGETVLLRPGTYDEAVVTVRPGVTIEGPRDAVLRGAAGSQRVVDVRHDDTTLRGFTIDGRVCAELVEACFRGKGIWVQGTVPHDGVTGARILDLRVTNLGDECIRLKYFASDNVVAGNTIGPCGVHDFAVPNTGSGQNGEGIYIGTAPEQLDRNPTPDPDLSNGNLVHGNTIDTRGGECVDIKEAARDNDVAHNSCTGQQPRNGSSGAMDARGPSNTFRYNHIHHNAAAGIRIGGDRPGDAVGNAVHHNVITDNARGGIKVQDPGPHGAICGNLMHGNVGGDVVGAHTDGMDDPTRPCSRTPGFG
ncbi:right-handed parallel beta-helix repeat-containing protein [Pseudonocardia zijingensis]|uniref:Right-handed parallel beta-helix repeat-containing protein n=1 Tax=Pseudonocardia zijingensis TaxID=153376 RepID=A0ABP3ZD62_9PSEU